MFSNRLIDTPILKLKPPGNGRKPTKEEIQAKADATRLSNLRAKITAKKPLTAMDKTVLKRLEAKDGTSF